MNKGADPEALHHFFELTPDRVLDSVEMWGFKCTGRYLALNSMENRVMEVEVEVDEAEVKSPSDRFRVIKFYRPGRWSREQIGEEHRFLMQLSAQDIPVVTPLKHDGETLGTCPDVPIFFSVYPKCGGRTPQELSNEEFVRMGRLIARMHLVGAQSKAPSRLKLTPKVYGEDNLAFLLSSGVLPETVREPYERLVNMILSISAPWFERVGMQRIHGDLHLGNILMGREGPLLVDFDDMVEGPPVQDLWLIIPGRDEDGRKKRDLLLSGYEEIRSFDRSTLRLIEPLRALRFVHFTSWIARRWEDPSFQRVFSRFGSNEYWREQLADLQEQLEFIQGYGNY